MKLKYIISVVFVFAAFSVGNTASAAAFKIECGRNTDKYISVLFDGKTLEISEYLPEGFAIKRDAGIYRKRYKVLSYKKDILKPQYISFFLKYSEERDGELHRYTSRIRYADKGGFNALNFESVPIDDEGFLTLRSSRSESYGQCSANIT